VEILVRMLKMPAKRLADATAVQLTSDINAAVPMVAIAVWATVLNALLRAAIRNSLLLMFI
jgi:hypothetical protein